MYQPPANPNMLNIKTMLLTTPKFQTRRSIIACETITNQYSKTFWVVYFEHAIGEAEKDCIKYIQKTNLKANNSKEGSELEAYRFRVPANYCPTNKICSRAKADQDKIEDTKDRIDFVMFE